MMMELYFSPWRYNSTTDLYYGSRVTKNRPQGLSKRRFISRCQHRNTYQPTRTWARTSHPATRKMNDSHWETIFLAHSRIYTVNNARRIPGIPHTER